uniref:C2 domain-containing protein n=2 Tax=Plectus sambesii TaxID=2011161 RepID=A0A914XGZ1_9BILA
MNAACPGVFGCASTSHHTDDTAYAMAIDHPPLSADDSASDSPGGTPMVRRKQQEHRSSSGVTRRQKIWRSLKTQLAFRSRSSRDQQSTAELVTRSHPDLTEDGDFDSPSSGATAAGESASRKTSAMRLKSIIRRNSQSSTASGSSPAKVRRRLATSADEHSRVEFVNGGAVSTSRHLAFNSHTQVPSTVDASNTASHRADEGKDSSPFVTFLVKVHLKDGHDLVIRDASGSSDPYVKFKYKTKMLYKSNTIFKNLNPVWEEEFSQLIDDPTTPLQAEVYDYDRFAMDDFMGAASVDLSKLRFWEPTDIKLLLAEEGSEEYMGYINLVVTILPQTGEEKEQFLRKSVRGPSTEMAKKTTKSAQVWSSVVNIVLVEAKNLLPTEISVSAPLPDPYVKFKLGTEKFKTKPATKTLDPKWLEQFDLHIFDESHQSLEIMVYDKRSNVFMGRCSIDLTQFEREITHQRWFELEDGAGSILLLLSISGTATTDTVVDLADSGGNDARLGLIAQYSLAKSFSSMRDVGHLIVKVFKAQGLAAADIGGKSDPFAVLELVNARLQTHTEYKTLNPEWNKLFTFNVKDIHAVLEITIFDEDPNKKVEFLGKVAVPLLKIRNGEKRWYALKDRKLQHRAKGQILLEMDVVWNPVKAAIRTFNPKETKYISQEPKFKRQVFMNNVQRVKQFVVAAVEVRNFVQSCFDWESPIRSILAFICFMVITYCFETYLLPLCLLLLFVKAYVFKTVVDGLGAGRKAEQEEYYDSEDDDGDLDDKGERGTSLKERVAAVQDTLAMVQNSLDFLASLLERIRNTFNFTSPYLSTLAIAVLSIATMLLYMIPLRWIIMAWGINKFTKKLRNPHFIPNNELLDFLSRVPSDKELRLYGEFRPDPMDGHQAREYLQRNANKRTRNTS